MPPRSHGLGRASPKKLPLCNPHFAPSSFPSSLSPFPISHFPFLGPFFLVVGLLSPHLSYNSINLYIPRAGAALNYEIHPRAASLLDFTSPLMQQNNQIYILRVLYETHPQPVSQSFPRRIIQDMISLYFCHCHPQQKEPRCVFSLEFAISLLSGSVSSLIQPSIVTSPRVSKPPSEPVQRRPSRLPPFLPLAIYLATTLSCSHCLSHPISKRKLIEYHQPASTSQVAKYRKRCTSAKAP